MRESLINKNGGASFPGSRGGQRASSGWPDWQKKTVKMRDASSPSQIFRMES